jgi:hypothetical protein
MKLSQKRDIYEIQVLYLHSRTLSERIKLDFEHICLFMCQTTP